MTAPTYPSEETTTVTKTNYPSGVSALLLRYRLRKARNRANALRTELFKSAKASSSSNTEVAALEILTYESPYWLHHQGFTYFIQRDGDGSMITMTSPPCVDWWEVSEALNAGRLPAPAEQQRILRLAVSVAIGTPVDLRDCFEPGGYGPQALMDTIREGGIRSEAS